MTATTRPHQALGMATPADRFSTARSKAEQDVLPLRLPAPIHRAPCHRSHHPRRSRPSPRGGPGGSARLGRRGDRVRTSGARQREHGPGQQTVLARTRQSRHDHHVLGRRRCHPLDRRWCPRSRPTADPRTRKQRSHRGRPHRQQRRRHQPRRPPAPGRRDPVRPASQHPHRYHDAHVLRPRHPRNYCTPAPTHSLRPSPEAVWCPPGRPAARYVDRTNHGPAQGQQHRRHHDLRTRKSPSDEGTLTRP